MKSIAVFCGSSTGENPSFKATAYELGEALASQSLGLIYGGAKIGLMGAVADGALSKNGKVTGVIPSFLKTKEVAHEHLSQLITVETMHERKTKMSSLADGFIVLPGGFGTMEEFFEILTWAQLGLHQKPIGILNIHGYYNKLLEFFHEMRAENLIQKTNLEMVLTSESIADLLKLMTHYNAPSVKSWLPDNKST